MNNKSLCDESPVNQDDNLILELQTTKQKLCIALTLNENLRRIAIERANARRGITPKKKHDGYLVLYSTQYSEHYTAEVAEPGFENKDREWLLCNNRIIKERRSAETWRSILQTPYDASLPLTTIVDQIWQDLKENGVLRDLKCEMVLALDNTHPLDLNIPQNRLYHWAYKANYIAGFWEMTLYTVFTITVPIYRRPVHGKSSVLM